MSGVPCTYPIRITLVNSSGQEIGSAGSAGVPSGAFCDYPVYSSGTQGKYFWGMLICINGGCNGADGTLVLDGSFENSGYVFDGTLTFRRQGGWAFELCDSRGCDTGTAITPSGFYWPTGDAVLGNSSSWLALGCGQDIEYLSDKYHLGKDIPAPVGASVYAVSSGEVAVRSLGGWGRGNVALIIEHSLNSGIRFFGIYGHIKSDLNVGDEVTPGQKLGSVGPYVYGSHLHFGIHTGPNVPPVPYGAMPCTLWPAKNGFDEPISWITNRTPYLGPWFDGPK